MILVMVMLLLFSAFFSASETALVSASIARVQSMKNKGVKNAQILLELLDKKESVIRVLLMGNNFVNIAASTIATAMFLDLLGDSGESLVVATAVMTVIIIIYCEILPKTYAVRNAESIALKVANICKLLVFILSMANYIIQKIVEFNLWVLRLQKTNKTHHISPLEELKGALDHHHEKGLMFSEDKYMLGGVIDLEKIQVNEIMIYRKDMLSINIDSRTDSIIKTLTDGPHTRVPVWQGNEENIIGILHVKDLLSFLRKKQVLAPTKIEIQELLREPWFIPNTTNLKMQLQAFRDRHYHFALVVDEYGELDGLITLEDIVEEIFGQIDDEHDVEDNKIFKNKDGSITVDGDLSIRDLNREMHWKLPEKLAATIGGVMFHLIEKVPSVGECIEVQGYNLRLMKRKGNKLIKIKVKEIKE